MDSALVEARRDRNLADGIVAAADVLSIGVDMIASTLERPDLPAATDARLRALRVEAQWLVDGVLGLAESLDTA